MIKRTILGFLLTAIATWMLASPFTVISENPNELVVEFRLPDWNFDYIEQNGQRWHRISCDDASSFVKEGFPELVSFSEAVGIPIDGDVSINVSNGKQTKLNNINLSPARKMVINGWDVDYIFYQDHLAYSKSVLYPAQVVDKGSSAFIGDRRFIPLQVYPFQ
ncbi:MAG: C25 family peptidase propeptide domain-containing protein, partial [Candidatus Cloacimonadaceae bacterium]|nr:C25 family peptidase propeptide domain-containing protein [Candidatus Cloacimonadaceae bacterium]